MLNKLLPPDLLARLSEAYAHPCYPGVEIFEAIYCTAAELGRTGIPVQHDKLLDSLTYGADGNRVTAHFQDGTTATGNILIGADGARSVVREQLLGENARLTPSSSIMMMMNADFNDAEKALRARSGNPMFKMALHPPGKMILIALQNVLDENDPTTWTFVLGGLWKGNVEDYPDNETRLAAFREAAAPFCEPYSSVASWVPDGTRINLSGINYWATIPWDNHGGRVTLVGDAAHPMTPVRGRGLHNCIADALNFVDAVSQLPDRGGLPELVAGYEAEMIPRGRSEVEASVKDLESVLDWDRVEQTKLITEGVVRNIVPAV